MSQFVPFKFNDAIFPGYIRFSITKSAFDKIVNHPKQGLLRNLSNSKTLLFTKGKNDGCYELFTNEGSYFCVISDDNNALLITGFSLNNLYKQNNAMKNGIIFKVNDGIIIQIKLKPPYNYFFDIVNGVQYSDNRFMDKSVIASVEYLKKTILFLYKQGTVNGEEKILEYKPAKKLSDLLDVAEKYAILSSELEEKKAHEIGKIPYYSIEAADYNRIDRIAYKFYVGQFDENIFKVGVQLEVTDKNDERYNCEIIEVDIEKAHSSFILLFNEQIDIRLFNKNGWLCLSFSSVNKDVQLAAIEKIRAGEAEARYMDKVLGENQSRGFEANNLNELERKLNQKEYPPNKSQKNAIKSGINAKDAFLVMGPPGTGKTTVILEWVKYFVKKEHKRVLISSQNNKAVDNVLSRISDDKQIDMIRIGSESKLQPEIIPFLYENKIKALRENISEHTSANILNISEHIVKWQRSLPGIGLVKQLNDENKVLEEQCDSDIEERLVLLYRTLTFCGEEDKRIKEELISIERDWLDSKERLEQLNNKKNIIGRIISFLPKKHTVKKITKLKERYDQLCDDEKNNVDKYNSFYPNYEVEYNKLLGGSYLKFYNQSISREKTIVEISKDLPQADQWKLFETENIRRIDWYDNEQVNMAEKEIKALVNRASSICDVINQWKLDMETKQNYALNEIILESVDLVGATCIGINSQKKFNSLDFDVTIIDEAGQIQIHNALVPMSVSNKIIMLGDHKQIPPIADQEMLIACESNGIKTDMLEKSLFEKMYNDMPGENKTMLDTQYRMPAEIAEIISEWFYEGVYFSPEFKKNINGQIPKLSNKPVVIIDTSFQKNRYETKIPDAGSHNKLEASIVKDILSYLLNEVEISYKEIGVISAYKSQVKLIKKLLHNILDDNEINDIVATLDSFQGQERDIIIYSFTKSSGVKPEYKRIGFLNELRRLNVAMTRCKKTLVLIGDMKFLSSCKNMPEDDFGDLVYEKSEKQFSDFIMKMVRDVKNGRGDIITYSEFCNRMKGE